MAPNASSTPLGWLVRTGPPRFPAVVKRPVAVLKKSPTCSRASAWTVPFGEREESIALIQVGQALEVKAQHTFMCCLRRVCPLLLMPESGTGANIQDPPLADDLTRGDTFIFSFLFSHMPGLLLVCI